MKDVGEMTELVINYFRYLRLPIIKKEQSYCGNSEIAVLRGAVGQCNVIPTLPYESVPPMYKSAYVVECP